MPVSMLSGAARALAVCAALSSLTAQTSVVIPAEYHDADAPGLGEIAGFTQAFRQQVLVHKDELAGLRGREIIGLAVRREAQLPMPFTAGKAQLVISLSDRARHPSAASARFADNRGPQPVVVFRGSVDVPAVPAPVGKRVPWSAPATIEIALATPFRYGEGSLCIEVEGQPVAGQRSPMWLVDHASWAKGGSMTMAGRSCDPQLQALAVCPSLLPGTTLTLYASGPNQTTGICLVGHERKTALDLTAQGAPACLLHVDAFEAWPALYPRGKREPITRIERAMSLPAQRSLLGAHVAIQWVQFPNPINALRAATTHVQVLRLAQGVPAAPGASVRSPALAPGQALPDHGEVQPQHMPVLRFLLR